MGFTEPHRSPGTLVVSYTTVSPLPVRGRAVCSLWHCPAGHPGWALPTTLLYGARTFLGTPEGATRPSGRLVCSPHTTLPRGPSGTTPLPRARPVRVDAVIVLLPPSEGKTAPASGPPVDLEALTLPELAPERRTVLEALAAVSALPDALDVLGVGASLAEEVARNTWLEAAPAAPAAHVYTGVLYAAADLGGALEDPRAAARLGSVLTVSALWGAVAPSDVVPAYRLPMGTDLPGVGPLARFWREPLRALDARVAGDVVVDCRSAAYAAAYRPRGAEHVAVKVLREHDGRRAVVSHHAKHTRGLLTGHLLRRTGEPPTTAAGLLDAAREMVGGALREASLVPGRAGSATLELVV